MDNSGSTPQAPEQEVQPTSQQPEPDQFAPQAPSTVQQDTVTSETPIIQPQYAQSPPVQTQPIQQLPAKDPGHGMGIASLITSILGLGLVGIILGAIGMSKSKKAGFKTNVMALIGLILGVLDILVFIVIAGLVVANFQGAQATARDTQRVVRINSMHSKLEEYYNENIGYPTTMNVANFPGLDAQTLNDNNGQAIVVYTNSATETEASSTAMPNDSKEFQYIGYACDPTSCQGYVLRTYIEKPTTLHPNPYTKTGLMNP